MTALDAELKSLRTSYNYLEADSKRKQDIVDQSCSAMAKMEEDNNSLIKVSFLLPYEGVINVYIGTIAFVKFVVYDCQR